MDRKASDFDYAIDLATDVRVHGAVLRAGIVDRRKLTGDIRALKTAVKSLEQEIERLGLV